MPSILISKEGFKTLPLVILYCIHSHASRILLRILYVSRERCGALPEVSTGSHVSSSARRNNSALTSWILGAGLLVVEEGIREGGEANSFGAA
jgi:hypothetical protein